MIAVGRHHSAIVSEDDILLTTGANGSGQLGVGNTEDLAGFTLVSELPVIMAAVGNEHTAVINDRGELLVAGSNFKAQLGMPNNRDQPEFVKPPYKSESELILVRCGAATTITLSIYGEVLMCGVNIVAIGLGEQATTLTYCNSLLKVNNISNIWIVTINGYESVVYVDDDNILWTSSANSYPEKLAEAVDVRTVVNLRGDIIILDQQGQVFSLTDLVRPIFTNVDQIFGSIDGNSVCFLSQGQAIVMDENYSTKLIAENILRMGYSGPSFIGLNMDNRYVGSGDNQFGQLGAPPADLVELTQLR